MPDHRDLQAGEALPDNFRCQSVDGAPARADEAIFPIVSQRENGTFVAIGTGFFIAEHGVFVTAAHVIEDVLDQSGNATGPFGLFQFLPNNHVVLRPIRTATRHPIADIAVGIAAPMRHNTSGVALRNPLLTLSLKSPPLGTRVFTYAYPRSEVTRAEKQEVRFFPSFYEGTINAHYPNGRDNAVLPGACYETSMVIHGGASGGPVFDDSGRVFAINSTAFGDESLSHISCISSIIPLALPGIVLPGTTEPRSATVGELCASGFVPCSA